MFYKDKTVFRVFENQYLQKRPASLKWSPAVISEINIIWNIVDTEELSPFCFYEILVFNKLYSFMYIL